ncbi:carbohydrate porin [Endozoicomonas sp. GU-1]|uniref:carbohydrate porin n=2 Tax=Endozoicomonas sp. GU-1 TaxID=3009078 RepID=UPI0022B4855B|nr:carbohydrate porin [Endozoicomonas sp. GU-1]WBA79533.1 carbohydrate porin [Endozoicomonas sp. GU-1]
MKKTLLATAILLATSAANAAWTSPDGSLTIGGDAEINFDVVDRSYENRPNNGDNNPEIELNDDSRVKMMVQWDTTREDGSYISAKIEPLMKTNGTVALDDAYLMFGRKDSWAFQIGRYEAMNLFPLGKDVALFYADGADSIGSGIYYYMAKEGRGRGGDAGQARIISEMGNWTAEVSTVYGETKSVLESSKEYLKDAVDIDSSHNSFMVRPAVNYLSDDGFFSISFGGEYEVNGDSVTATNTVTKEKFELSDRYGLAATTTLNFGELVWNTSIAMQDAKDAWEARTFNTNITYKDAFGLGTSYAVNKFTNKPEDAKSYAVYTAYTMPIMDFTNATVTFALSYSDTENAYGNKGQDSDTTAFRTRFNYYF